MAPGSLCGIIKAHTFGNSLKSHEQSSQINTRQGIHEVIDLQDVLLCTQQCIQGHKQLGEMDIFYNGNPVVRNHVADIPVCITYDIIYTFPYPWI